jgi:hypothetical protein
VPQATPVAPSPGPEISPAPSQPSSPPDESTPLPDPRPSVEVEEPSSQPSVAPAQEGDEFDDEDEAPVDGRRSLFGGLGRLTSGLTRLSGRKAKETASITVEHGSVKLLITRGLEVVDHTIVDANQRLFREGLVSDAARLSGLVEDELGESLSRYRHVVSAVPGYQTTTRRLDLPNAKGMDPKVIIPQEAQRKLGISAEHSYLTWHKLPSSIDKSQWLIMSATNRSTASLGATTGQLGMDLVALELRSFSLARAVNQADAVIAWTAPDGCDAVVVRSWMPITHQTAYWGTAASIEASDLVNRVTEVVESTIAAHDVSNPEMAVAEDIPIYITGSPVGSDDTIAARVANNTRHPLRQPEPPIHIPEGFPLHDLIINVGLALRGV